MTKPTCPNCITLVHKLADTGHPTRTPMPEPPDGSVIQLNPNTHIEYIQTDTLHPKRRALRITHHQDGQVICGILIHTPQQLKTLRDLTHTALTNQDSNNDPQ